MDNSFNKKIVDGVIEFPEFDASALSNPSANKLYLYLNGGSLKQKDSSGTETSVGGGGAGTGDVVGPAGGTANDNIALFSSTTGKAIKNGPAISSKADTSALTSHTSNTSNPHSVTASQVGLGNVNNTSDANKPVSTATQTALDLKKSIAPRVEVLTDAATVTPNMGTSDAGYLASLSQTTTIANPTGSPSNFQQYTLRIKSTSTQTLSWGSQYRGSDDMALPTTTSGSSKTDFLTFVWNAQDTKIELVGKNFGH